jgi:predicted GNAT family N-acyltransferase
MAELVVKVVQDPALLEECFALRFRVFVDEQGVPPHEELDDFDAEAQHFAAVLDDKVVGTARLVDKGSGVGKIGRMAVEAQYRGTGIGREVMQSVMSEGFLQFHTLILDAQTSALPFYEKLGFTAEGDEFLDCGIPHLRMRKQRP